MTRHPARTHSHLAAVLIRRIEVRSAMRVMRVSMGLRSFTETLYEACLTNDALQKCVRELETAS